jgi:hypothetical protein
MSVVEVKLEVPVVISEWLRCILVDPLSKRSFVQQNKEGFEAACGFLYKFCDGVPDFSL